MRNLNWVIVGLLLSSIWTIPARAQLVDASALNVFIDSLIDGTMKNPKTVGGNVVYSLSSEEACDFFMGDPAADPVICAAIASKFKVTQYVDSDSLSAAAGRLVWSYNGHNLFKYTYSPSLTKFYINLPEYKAGGLAVLADTGGSTTDFDASTPNTGAVELAVDFSSGNSAAVRITFKEALYHSQNGLVLSFAKDSYIESSTQPGSNLVSLNLLLDNSYVELPGSVDYFYSSATSVKHDFTNLHGKIIYNTTNGSFSTEALRLGDYKVLQDNAVGFAITSSADLTATMDLANLIYSASSATDLNLHIVAPILGGTLVAGDYKVKTDANSSASVDLANASLDLNLSHFLVQEPADFLIAGGVSMFSAGTAASISADALIGGMSYSDAYATYTLNFDSFLIDNLKVKEDATVQISANHELGDLNGSIVSDAASSGSFSLGEQDLRVSVVDAMGIPGLEVGDYRLANGAGNTLNAAMSNTGATQVTYALNNMIVSGPYSGTTIHFSENGSGTINYSAAASAAQNILVGSLGTGSFLMGAETIASWSQTGSTTIALDLVSASPNVLVNVSNPMSLSISHNNTIPNFGVGSVAITLGANTAVSNLTVTSGSASIDLTGHPYSELFEPTNGMLKGLDTAFACDTGVTGPCSIAIH